MKNVIKILKKAGAVLTNDHFVLTSGRHTASYINPDKILPHPSINAKLSKLIAKKYKNQKIEIVVGPAYGGIIFSQWVAFYLSELKNKKILGIFTEKTPDKHQLLERGFDTMIKDKNVLIVEDITATGSSVIKVIKSVREAGGIVKGIAVIVNRDPKIVNSETFGRIPFTSLVVLKIKSYEEKNCPLCIKKIPINVKIGHGKKYLEERGKK